MNRTWIGNRIGNRTWVGNQIGTSPYLKGDWPW